MIFSNLSIPVCSFAEIEITGFSIFFSFNTSSNYTQEYNLCDKNKSMDYQPVEGKRYFLSYIHANDYAPIEEKYYSIISSIPRLEYYVKDSSIFHIDEILEKGSQIILLDNSVFVTPSKFRVIDIKNNLVVVEDLENITCSINLSDSFSMDQYKNIEFYTNINNKKVILEPTNYKFIEKNLQYEITLKIPNDINVFSNQAIRVYAQTTYFIEGMFVYSSFIQEDENGLFIYKTIVLNNERLFKPIYIEKIGEISEYSIIKSNELSESNMVIKYE